MPDRIATVTFTPTTMQIEYEYRPDDFNEWLLRASPAELLEGGYLIARALNRVELACLRDYTIGRIDALDSLEPKE